MPRLPCPPVPWKTLLLASLVACTDGSGKTDADSATAEDTAPSSNSDTHTDAPGPMGSLLGQVVDASGTPLEGVCAQLCWMVCKHASTAADGTFRIDAEPGRWSFELIVDSGDPASGWASPLAPVDLVDAVERTLERPVVVPRLDAIRPLPEAARVEVGEGLWIDAVPDEWEAPLVTPNADPWMGGVKVDPAEVGLPLDGIEAPLAAAWYVAPLASHPAQPWPLTIANAFGWAPGTSAEVWVADYGSQSWLSAGPAVVSEDGRELTGATLSVFGTVLLFEPPPP